MAGPIHFIEIREQPVDLTRAAHAQAMTAVHQAEARWWAAKFLPRHFTPQARHRYRHQPRKEKYLARKRRDARVGRAIMGGTVDLVRTGLMMRAVLGHQTVKASPREGTVRMFGPRYLWQFNKKVGTPDKAAEILRINHDELADIERLADLTYQFEHARLRGQRTVVIK